MKESCLIISFWLGNRRIFPPVYNEDRLIYVKKQIEYLMMYENNLDTIYFNFNLETHHYDLLNKALELIPDRINNSKVKINIRENIGFSYGAWNDIVLKEIKNYKYFIFNEDDYFFVQNNWDDYLINKYNSKDNTGYLAMGVRPLLNDNTYRDTFHSVGISSSVSLQKIIDKFGCLLSRPLSKDVTYYEGMAMQSAWSQLYKSVGLTNYDVRDDYQVEFGLTDRKEDIWRLWEWNENILIKNSKSMFQPSHTWFICSDNEYIEGFVFPF